jgi:hypothetical protein
MAPKHLSHIIVHVFVTLLILCLLFLSKICAYGTFPGGSQQEAIILTLPAPTVCCIARSLLSLRLRVAVLLREGVTAKQMKTHHHATFTEREMTAAYSTVSTLLFSCRDVTGIPNVDIECLAFGKYRVRYSAPMTTYTE